MQDSLKEMKEFYDYFVNASKLGPNSCVIFYFNSDDTTSSAPKIICKYLIFKNIFHCISTFNHKFNYET